MIDHAANAKSSFAECQGHFGGRGPTAARNINDTAQMLAEVTCQLSLMRHGFLRLSVGLTQLAAAIAEMKGRR